jgi:ribosomal protein L11 methyltransferase
MNGDRMNKPPASYVATFYIGPPRAGGIQTETLPTTAQAIADRIAERFGLEDIAVSLSDAGGGRWQVAIHFRNAAEREPVRAAVAAVAGAEAAASLVSASMEAADWVRQSLAGLQPVEAGRFIVHGAHDRARVPFNRIGIEIEAALAFGTGHHGTTRGCLLALDAICKAGTRPEPAMTPTRFADANRPPAFRGRYQNRPERSRMRILDVGTGSGVLAIAAARALHVPVLGTDIDAFAVNAARGNAWLNRAGHLVSVVLADGIGARAVRAHGPYDLIFANILLGPLKRIATPLRSLAARGGRVVLSGILPSQANAVIAAYRPLALERRLDIDGWTTLVLVRRASKLPVGGRRRKFTISATLPRKQRGIM